MNHSTTAASSATTPSAMRAGLIRDATARARAASRRAKADRIDRLGFALAVAVHARARRDDRRRGDVAGAAVLDFDDALIIALRDAQARRAEIHDVAARSQVERVIGNAVVQHLGAVGRLHEQLILVQPEIRLGAGRAGRPAR